MQLYFAVPDTATTHDGVLVRSFLRQCAVSTDLARAVKFRGGGFFADGVPVLANRRIFPGQMLSFALPPEGDGVTPQPEIPVKVVYEDAFAVVLEKPPQLAVHPTLNYPGGTLANGYAAWAAAHGHSPVFRPVNRIDKDTSGLLMIAKNNKAHESLAEQLRVHSVTREYRALVYDNIREDELTIDIPIGRDERNRLRRAVNGSNPKEAVTHVKVLERYGKYTLIAARLETGRTHQIRVHLSHIKHPLVGDITYGPKKQIYGLDGQLLHAKTLGFIHPSTGEYMEFDSPLPDYFKDILERIERSRS